MFDLFTKKGKFFILLSDEKLSWLPKKIMIMTKILSGWFYNKIKNQNNLTKRY